MVFWGGIGHIFKYEGGTKVCNFLNEKLFFRQTNVLFLLVICGFQIFLTFLTFLRLFPNKKIRQYLQDRRSFYR